MKMGPEYSASWEKRAFDVAMATLLMPAEKLTERLMRHLVGRALGDPDLVIYRQERMGPNETPFMIDKFRTLDPTTKEPFGNWARLFRKLGVDCP